MGRQKRLVGIEQRWAGDAESVWSGMADWRAAHPKATLSEIEVALDERLDRLRARLLPSAPTPLDQPMLLCSSSLWGDSDEKALMSS